MERRPTHTFQIETQALPHLWRKALDVVLLCVEHVLCDEHGEVGVLHTDGLFSSKERQQSAVVTVHGKAGVLHTDGL
jgi:hypothetical protein